MIAHAAFARAVSGAVFVRQLPANGADHVAAATAFGNLSNRLGRRLMDRSSQVGLDMTCNEFDLVCAGGVEVVTGPATGPKHRFARSRCFISRRPFPVCERLFQVTD